MLPPVGAGAGELPPPPPPPPQEAINVRVKSVINLISEEYEIWKIEKEGYSVFGEKYFNSLEPLDEDKNET